VSIENGDPRGAEAITGIPRGPSEGLRSSRGPAGRRPPADPSLSRSARCGGGEPSAAIGCRGREGRVIEASTPGRPTTTYW
jgi:hypothetical protein